MSAASADVRDGVSAYARGDCFDAHEHFEHAWLESGPPGSRSLELQALAQVAAAVHKLRVQHKPEAARAIMMRARAKLGAVASSAHGLDLGALRQDVDAWLRGADDAAPVIRLR